MADVIDLTLSSDDEAAPAPAPKRARAAAAGDSDFEIVEPSVAPHGPLSHGGAQGAADADADVVVTAVTGVVPLADFVHPRHACANLPFARTPHASFCAKCCCFVCDVPARDCRRWGTGAAATDHANAEPGPLWNAARVRQRAPQQPPPPAARRFVLLPGGGWVPRAPSGQAPGAQAPGIALLQAAAAAGMHAAPQLPAGLLRVLPAGPTALPDPRTLGPSLLELGTLELPVRAAASTCVAAVAALLRPHGQAYVQKAAGPTSAPAPPLTLETLFLDESGMRRAVAPGGWVTRRQAFATTGSDDDDDDGSDDAVARGSFPWFVARGPRKAVHLALRRLPTPHAAPRSPVVHWRVLMVRADGAAAPQEHAVSLPRRARRADLIAAVEAAAALGPNERIVLCVARPTDAAGATSWVLDRFINGVLYDFSVEPPAVYGTRPEELRRRIEGSCPPRFIAYRLPGRAPPPLPQGSKVGPAGALAHACAPSFIVVHLRARKEKHLQYDRVGFPILLPMPAAGAFGGEASERQLAATLRTAMRPMLRAGAEWRAPESIMRCDYAGRVYAHSGAGGRRPYGMDSDSDESYSTDDDDKEVRFGLKCALDELRSMTTGLDVYDATARPIIYAAATWPAAELAAFLDLAALASPAQHASAAAHPFDEAALAMEWREDERARSAAPSIVDELVNAAAVRWEAKRIMGHQPVFHQTEPQIRYVAELHPAPGESARAPGGAGVLRVRIFTPRAYNAARPLLQDCHAAAPGRAGQLQRTLGALWAADSAAHRDNAALWARMAQMQAQNCTQRPTPGSLLSAIEATERPEMPQPAGLTVQLRPYQRQSLRFMMDAEDGGLREAFWAARTLRDGTRAWYSAMLDAVTRDEPPAVRGGFLCEEMGLGKTIVTLALVLANPQRAPRTSHLISSRATLVVCAVSLVGQWAQEVKERCSGGLAVHVFHGGSRIRDARKLADHDLVITTYATMVADYGGKKGAAANLGSQSNPLAAIDWFRIVLDESHSIKNATTAQSQACMALTGQRRWCVTGTPIATDVSDLAAQMRFLRLEPWSNAAYFAAHARDVFGPTSHRGGGQAALPMLYTLSRVMIRHTKQGSVGGAPVLSLPPVTESQVEVRFSPEERAAYDKARAAAVEQFAEFKAAGLNTISSKLIQIMALLLPMRRISSGGALSAAEIRVPGLTDPAQARAASKAEGKAPARPKPDEEEEEESCGICGEPADDAVRTSCKHVFCRECLLSSLPGEASAARCPTCDGAVDAAALQAPEAGAADGGADAAGPATLGRRACKAQPVALRSESKLRLLLRELAAMREADPSAKALVFSQYTGTLEWLKTRLTEEGFGYRTVTGSMPLTQRAAAIQSFQTAPPTTVFLLSVRSGAVGLNLTAANYVFLMEPVLNPALQAQAIGRAWRLGQTRPVTVKHLFVKDSVEERIMQLNADRAAGTGAAAGGASATLAAVRAKAKVSDIAGAIRSDRAALRLNELELLFS